MFQEIEPLCRLRPLIYHSLTCVALLSSKKAKQSYYTRVGETFTAYTFDPSVGMPALYRLLEKRRVKFVKKRVKDLEELSGYDYVFNCSGIGAARLFSLAILKKAPTTPVPNSCFLLGLLI